MYSQDKDELTPRISFRPLGAKRTLITDSDYGTSESRATGMSPSYTGTARSAVVITK